MLYEIGYSQAHLFPTCTHGKHAFLLNEGWEHVRERANPNLKGNHFLSYASLLSLKIEEILIKIVFIDPDMLILDYLMLLLALKFLKILLR